MKRFRSLAALVTLLACVGWVMAQQPSNASSQSQGQTSSQPSQARQGQTQAPPPKAQTGQTPNAQNPNAAANPSGEAGTAHHMPATGSPLGLLVLFGAGAVGAGTVLKKRARARA